MIADGKKQFKPRAPLLGTETLFAPRLDLHRVQVEGSSFQRSFMWSGMQFVCLSAIALRARLRFQRLMLQRPIDYDRC